MAESPDRDEAGRRIISIVHVGMLAAIPVYAIVLWLFGGHAAPSRPPGERVRLVWVLLGIGMAEWLAATGIGRRLLASTRGSRSDRVRRYFLVRFAAAEAMAVFGLFAGFTGVRPAEASLLFAASALALVLSAPTRASWEGAMEAAGRN